MVGITEIGPLTLPNLAESVSLFRQTPFSTLYLDFTKEQVEHGSRGHGRICLRHKFKFQHRAFESRRGSGMARC